MRFPYDLSYIFFRFGAGHHHLAAAARAFQLEIDAGAQHRKPRFAAGVLFFHFEHIADADVHGSPPGEVGIYRADGTTAVRRSPFAVRIETQHICETAK
jgi:hypothetical protein